MTTQQTFQTLKLKNLLAHRRHYQNKIAVGIFDVFASPSRYFLLSQGLSLDSLLAYHKVCKEILCSH